jgi:hypothetical protein
MAQTPTLILTVLVRLDKGMNMYEHVQGTHVLNGFQ